MSRTFANSTIALICIAPALIVAAALIFDAAAGRSPGGAGFMEQAHPVHHTTTVGRAG